MLIYPYQTVPDDWDSFYSEQKQQGLQTELNNFYQQKLPGIEKSVQETQFIAVDIETTGLDPQKDHIVSIGLVPFDAQRIYLAKAKYWVVSSRQLTSDSVVVHGITHSEVADAPTLRAVFPEVITELRNKQIVVHYRLMEREFFRLAVSDLFQQTWLFPVIDTLELEAENLRKTQSIFAKLFKRQLPSLRLPAVRQRYNLPEYGNHNALTDALATAELMQALIARCGLAERPIRNLWK